MTELPLPPGRTQYQPLLLEYLPIPVAVALGLAPVPLLWVWLASAYHFFYSLFNVVHFDIASSLAEFAFLNAVAIVAALVLFIPLLLVAVLVLGVLQELESARRANWPDSQVGTHVGAWTAMLVPLLIGLIFGDPFRRSGEVLLLYTLTALATPIGQYAGAWSQWVAFEPTPPKQPLRFGIRNLLLLTFALAIILTALKAARLFHSEAATFLIVWLVYQWLTMKLIHRFCRWRARRLWGSLD